MNRNGFVLGNLSQAEPHCLLVLKTRTAWPDPVGWGAFLCYGE